MRTPVFTSCPYSRPERVQLPRGNWGTAPKGRRGRIFEIPAPIPAARRRRAFAHRRSAPVKIKFNDKNNANRLSS